MESLMDQFQHLKIEWEEIILATNNFDDNNFIGGGGFGKVYKGALPQYIERGLLAFKRLDRIHGQGDAEFLKEMTFLSRYTHENLISLLGFCVQDKEMILVYEYASRGSLDRHLNSADLTWKQRLNICLGAAKGLQHLHDPRETGQRLIHCDIKSANILLDDDWNAKVSDFGLSKIAPANDKQNSMLVTNALGTIGYCDPLFIETYSLTKESDVYSFGVVLFEVLCGRLCYEKSNGQLKILVSRWKRSYKENKLDEIIFPDLRQNMELKSLETFANLAFQCLERYHTDRPRMSQVVETLETALHSQVKFQKLKLLGKYEEIVSDAVPPLTYISKEEVKVLLYKGFLVNGGTTWFSLNHDEEHYKMISIAACLIPFDDKDDISLYSFYGNSRFQKGCYSTNGKKFRTRVSTQFLSQDVTYTVNLVFNFVGRKEANRPGYLPLKYKFEGDTKISMVYLTNKSEDEGLIARLYEFTSMGRTVDLEFWFEDHAYCNGLDIEGIEFQPLKHVEHHQASLELNYEEILKAVIPPLYYRSLEELKLLLFNGVFLNGNKSRFSLNNNEEHGELVSIKECLILEYRSTNYSDRYSQEYNSRFTVGTYNTHGNSFKTHVTTQFLSPLITYTVNLIFKWPHMLKKKSGKQQYLALRYKLNKGEEKISIVHVADKSEDEWLVARLHQFTSDDNIVDLNIDFDLHYQYLISLEIEGIEFQPLTLEINAELEQDDDHKKYQEIVKSAEPPLIYRSIRELKLLLSKGVHLKGGNTWFYINDNGQPCEMISIKECMITDPKKSYLYYPHHNSRFLAGTYYAISPRYKIRVRAQFLLPDITYTVNLVFKYPDYNSTEQLTMSRRLGYILEGGTETSFSYLAYKREDNWWMVELCQFTSHGTTVDLEIIFDGGPCIEVEGIEFLPLELEKAENHVLEDENIDYMQPLSLDSDSDTYWEQKLPDDYQIIIKWSKDSPQWTTKKELYSILSKGFLLNNGVSRWLPFKTAQEWFSIDKNGKKCLMLSARKACAKDAEYTKWLSLPKSRFGKTTVLKTHSFKILTKIKSEELSSETTYATYLVYKLPLLESTVSPLIWVSGRDLVSDDESDKDRFWYVYLYSPETPVINVGGKTCNPLNRPKIKDKDLPKKRSDGWTEVKVWEFQTPTPTTNQIIPISLKFSSWRYDHFGLRGVIIQGIEFRPI